MTSRRALRLAALVIVLAPVGAAVVLLFGGTAYPTCLGGYDSACWPRALVGPYIRTVEGIYVSLAICGLAWLAANSVILADLVRVDRRRLVRLAVGIALITIVMGTIGFLTGLQSRLLYAAQGAVAWGLAGLAIAWVIGLTWAGLRTSTATEAPSSGGPRISVD